jgi:hypothetical protein
MPDVELTDQQMDSLANEASELVGVFREGLRRIDRDFVPSGTDDEWESSRTEGALLDVLIHLVGVHRMEAPHA